MKIRRRSIAAALCVCLVLWAHAAYASVSAPDPPGGIQPRWTTLSSIALSMTYSGGQIHWGGSISGNSSVVSVKAIYTLEKQNSNGAYSFVGDWSFSGTNAWLDSSGDKTAPLGTYRLTVAVTATTRTGTVENTSNSLVKTFS